MPATVGLHTLFRPLGLLARAFVRALPKPSGTFNRAERFEKLQDPLQSQEASPAAPISRGDLKSVGPPPICATPVQPGVTDADFVRNKHLATDA